MTCRVVLAAPPANRLYSNPLIKLWSSLKIDGDGRIHSIGAVNILPLTRV